MTGFIPDCQAFCGGRLKHVCQRDERFGGTPDFERGFHSIRVNEIEATSDNAVKQHSNLKSEGLNMR